MARLEHIVLAHIPPPWDIWGHLIYITSRQPISWIPTIARVTGLVVSNASPAILANNPDARIRTDAACPEIAHSTSLARLRPDVTVTAANSILLVDVKVPFEKAGALDAVDKRNADHYEPLRAALAQATGKKVAVLTFVVGALGAWWPGNQQTLALLNIRGKANVARLGKAAIKSAIHASRNVWVFHTSLKDHK